MEKIKVCFISDTHTRHKRLNLQPADLLCFTGDFMSSGYSEAEIHDFINWVNNISDNYIYVVIIPGNHDRYTEVFPKEVIENLFYQNNGYEKGIRYIHNEELELDFGEKGKLKLYGTADQPIFFNWAFNRTPEELYMSYQNIPENLDILLTHCPSYDILDKSHVKTMRNPTGEEPLGSKELSLRLSEMVNPPRYHVFGHIHGDGGKTITIRNTTYINASIFNEEYQPVNSIITLDIEPKGGE